jgi:hypothetical protein
MADVRFDNEAEWIKDMGGYVFKIDSDRVLETMDNEAKAHSSESGINPKYIDFTITNNKNTHIGDIKLNLRNSVFGMGRTF